MRIGGCKNGHQIRSYINRDKKSYLNASRKYQAYVNDKYPACPKTETLEDTEFHFPGTKNIFNMPVWDGLILKIENDADIHILGMKINNRRIYFDLLTDDSYGTIDTKNIKKHLSWFYQPKMEEELSVFILLLLKSELDNDVKNRDIVLEKVHQFFILDFYKNDICDEFIYLFLYIKRRFIRRWRKNIAHDDMIINKIPRAVKNEFFRVNKVMHFYVDVNPDKLFEPLSDNDNVRRLSEYLRENYKSLTNDVRLYYLNKELLKNKLQNFEKYKGKNRI